MKILTVLGTRPEIIRLSRVMAKLDKICDHKVVFTGQNFTPELSTIFFNDLKVRKPDYNLNSQSTSTWKQIGNILSETDEIFAKESPDKVLILGDTNSALVAQCAKRRGIPVFHMEAGNRCYDDRVPEEVNRRIIDHSSDILLPYTNGSRNNLLREGFHPKRVLVTGNPIKEVIDFYSSDIDSSPILESLQVVPKNYMLATLHRSENVDSKERLQNFINGFQRIAREHNRAVLLSLHPRTKSKLEQFSIPIPSQLKLVSPPGFFDFVKLEKEAYAILSDSGTVQEEGCILRVPTVTLRDVTERPETIECGSNILSGCEPELIATCLNIVLANESKWNIPREYLEANVSNTVTNILMGYSK